VALAFGLTSLWRRDARVAVLHLGGGSLGVSILEIGDGVFKVESVGGDTNLGGDDFDDALLEHLERDLRRQHGFDARKEASAWARLRDAAEQARIDLSGAAHARISLPCFCPTTAGTIGYETILTRAQLEKLSAGLVQRCRDVVQRSLADAVRTPRDVAEVFLVGGLVRMPRIQSLARELFPQALLRVLHSDEVVPGGAAIQGHELLLASRSDLLLVDVTPHEYGAAVAGGEPVVVIERNATFPVERTQVLTLPAGRDIRIQIFQGCIHSAAARRQVGEVVLDSVGQKGRVRLTFSLDHHGVLDVQVRGAGDCETRARMFPSGGLSAADVERLRREAEQESLLRGLRL
jgi:molecular chaperone DnaK